MPRTQEQGKVEIEHFTKAIECEVAAVALNPKYKKYGLIEWNVKSQLDLDVVNTVGADGKIVQTIVYSSGVPTVTPSLSGEYRNTNTAHVDFATIIPDAIKRFPTQCDVGLDPSGTHMGLAAWFASSLDALDLATLGGISYTLNFDLTVKAGARFGYVLNLIDADVGPAVSRQTVHRLTVTLGPPSLPATPIEVVVVNGARAIAPSSRAAGGARSSGRTRVYSPYSGQSPALSDPNLNRLLQQQAPVRLAPGTILR